MEKKTVIAPYNGWALYRHRPETKDWILIGFFINIDVNAERLKDTCRYALNLNNEGEIPRSYHVTNGEKVSTIIE